MPIRVFHGDDSRAFRRLIQELLPDDDIEVVGGGGTPEEVLEGVARTRPDVILLDQLGGAELADRLRELAPGLRVVLLTGFQPGDGDRELEARADGYLVKTADVDAMRAAVRGG